MVSCDITHPVLVLEMAQTVDLTNITGALFYSSRQGFQQLLLSNCSNGIFHDVDHIFSGNGMMT